uniref:Uncharacterized protein n=1 Tax=Strongyloides venezuelensis TaxID=75913 RepID=A0A0K0FPU9_STRVS
MFDERGIRTLASEDTSALNWRLRPLGHLATKPQKKLSGGESNPGLARDRRGYSPLLHSERKHHLKVMISHFFMSKECHEPGSNRRHLDLQSNALPTELSCTEKVKCRDFAHKIKKSTNFVKCRIFAYIKKC